MQDDRWTTVDQLLEAALERAPDARAAFVRKACGDDEALRREVESLLAHDASAMGFLSTPALDGGRPGSGTSFVRRQLGSYTLHAQLGVGGMGEVYRARDRKLGRDVAIKILPPLFMADPDRRARFDREARLLAALNHPHIGAIYGIEDSDGVRALVLELVEGDTLADRLARGPIPVREALLIARQIADALDAAHEKGIVHRDLKPANVKITSEGVVKVLDFGLAKAARGDASGPDLAALPTVTIGGTRDGMILGTTAYMSPEQARGKPVDKRADIWAFGCVLYEMLTGRVAFARDTISDTIAAILGREPEWGTLPQPTPASLHRLLQRCLDKDPRRRLHDIADARIEIEDVLSGAILSHTETAAAVLVPARPRPLWRRAIPVVLVAIASSTLAGTAAWYLRPATSLPTAQLGFTLPEGQAFTGLSRHPVVLSSDGTQTIYVANNRLYLRLMSKEVPNAIQGTEGFKDVSEPVFSPDGRSVAFYAAADQTLKRISVAGGTAVMLCAADNPTGMSWGPDGIVFGQGGKGIMRVSENGGAPKVLVRVRDGEVAHGPQLLPGGTHVLFTLATGTAADRWDRARVVVQSLTSNEPQTVIEGGSDARYLATGHLVYALSGSLFAVPFDVRGLDVTGGRASILGGVRRAAGDVTGAAYFSFSDTGSLVYVPGPLVSASSAQMDIALMDRNGHVDPLVLEPGPYTFPRVSPDDTRIAFGTDNGKEASVWIYDLARTSLGQRLNFDGNNRFPTWIFDSHVAFQSDRQGDLAIFWQPADFKGKAERLTTPAAGESHIPESWHGNTLLYSVTKGSEASLWALSLGDRKPTPFGDVHSSTPINAMFSPDGRWVAYSSTERGATTIYVQPFPATGARYQLPAAGSDSPKQPRWSRDQKSLFYNPNADEFKSVAVTTQPKFEFGKPVTVERRLRLGAPGSRTTYDTTRGGGLVGLVTAGQTQYTRGSDNQIRVYLNFFEDLKQSVPSP